MSTLATISARAFSTLLRIIHAGALLCLALVLRINPQLFQVESIYQPLGAVASAGMWSIVMFVIATLLMLACCLPLRAARLFTDAVAALVWCTLATLIGGMTGINMGTGIYGFMFLLSVTGFIAEMFDWLDMPRHGASMIQRVRAAGDRRLERR